MGPTNTQKTMLVTFGPTGENVEVGPNGTTPQKLSAITSNPIYLTTPAGYEPVQGTMTAGSSAFYPILGDANGHYIGFYAGDNKTLLVTKFKMDDATAVTDGLTALAVALSDDPVVSVTLASDGTVTATA